MARFLHRLMLGAAAAAAIAVAPTSARAGGDAAGGRVLVEKLECTRCHAATGLGVAAAPRARSCAGCHAWIAGTAHDRAEYDKQRARFPYWERYVKNVGSFLAVPDLATAGARLDEGWIASYVTDPYEVRPGLDERMVRAPVTEEEARAIAAFLRTARPPLSARAADAARIPPSRDPAHVAEGAALFEAMACGTCHPFGRRAASAPRGSAPDLAHARTRMSAGDVAAFIADPASFRAGSAMPSFDLTATQAARLRDYLLATPVEREPIAPIAADLPLLARPVRWEEVREAVFGRICVHCHMDPEKNAGEGGPGNTGGLGFEGKGLSLESWEPIAASGVLASRAPGMEPPLLERLRIRAVEHARELAGPHASPRVERDAAPRGMPMALPALTAAEMQLVRTWIAQGAPGPDGRAAVRCASGTKDCRAADGTKAISRRK